MAAFKHIRVILLGSVAATFLAACGADGVASPGEGVIVLPPSTPTTPTPPNNGGGAVTAAANCPSIVGSATLSNDGIIEDRTKSRQWRICRLPSRFTESTVLPKVSGVMYAINGRVDVGTDRGPSGAGSTSEVVLTIEPGVVLYGEPGPSWLAVNRGNKIQAVGTADKPIVFTGRKNVEGTADDQTSQLWGGVVLLGRAPVTDCFTSGAGVVEGTDSCYRDTEGASNAFYGGSVAADNSGRMSYVQIRYSGYILSADKELQGFTPSGVGSGTQIDHVQIHNSSDDGIEVFGGRVNMKHLVITGAEDDSLDTDVGYKGNIQFVLGIQRAGGEVGDSMMEIDSNGNEQASPRQNVKIANFTFVQRNNAAGNGAAILIRGGADYGFANGLVVASGLRCLRIDSATTTQAADPSKDEAGPPIFHSVAMQCNSTPFRGGGSPAVAEADVRAIFEAGTNNSSTFVPTLSGLFINGASETARAAFDLTAWGAFFTPTNYVGAVKDANDNWFKGWTCNSATADFGTSSKSCTAIPV
jgi:hypothetical protein